MTETLNEITATFGEAYTVAKESGALRDEYQKRFFQAATEELETKVLAQRVVEVPLPSAQSIEDIREYVSTYHPGWRFVDTREAASEESLDVLVERDPALMKFTYVNYDDGRVYGRTVSEGQPYPDLEAMKVSNPVLYQAVTKWLPGVVANAAEAMQWSRSWTDLEPLPEGELAQAVESFLVAHNSSRVLKDTDDLTYDQMEDIQTYLIPGKISTRLVPPRAAKPEELE